MAEWKATDPKEVDGALTGSFQDKVIEYIAPVHTQALALSDTINASFQEDVRRAAAMGNRVKTVSWLVAVIVPVLGIVAIFLLRTINESLRRLTAGTRMISQGQFWHRLPSGGADEFSELAADFNTMSARLEKLDSMKKDFVSHVSHELKAPLASIRQSFHLLLEQIPGPLNDQQRRLLRLSNRSAERLAAMVGNLLDASRMGAGSMEYSFAPADLLALARSVAEEFEVQARDKDITIRVDARGDESGFVAECDRDRMSQVVGNLIDNALKFSARGSEVVASMETKDTGPERLLVFSVRDSGVGVPEEHKAGIFGMFYQVKQGGKITGQGVGLGLAICRSIIEAHRGRIWVEDNPGGGSVFYFELPAMVRVEATTA
jgi:two-component system sensor histidine kinase GlrK